MIAGFVGKHLRSVLWLNLLLTHFAQLSHVESAYFYAHKLAFIHVARLWNISYENCFCGDFLSLDGLSTCLFCPIVNAGVLHVKSKGVCKNFRCSVRNSVDVFQTKLILFFAISSFNFCFAQTVVHHVALLSHDNVQTGFLFGYTLSFFAIIH